MVLRHFPSCEFPSVRTQDYIVPDSRDTTGRAAFRLSLQRVKRSPIHSFVLPMHSCARLSRPPHKMVVCSRRSPAEGENFKCASPDSPKTREVPWPLSFPPVTKKKPPAT